MRLIEKPFGSMRVLCDLNVAKRDNPEEYPTHIPEELHAIVCEFLTRRVRTTHTLTRWSEACEGITFHGRSGLKRSAYRIGSWLRVTDSRRGKEDRWFHIQP